MTRQLPTPEPSAQNSSLQLQELIRQAINQQGAISFARYMELCLYASGLGYYQGGMHKLGRGGDFTTAPEISPLFGRCIAQQIREILEHLGSGDILEFGAGTGQLAIDILLSLEQSSTLPTHYYIIELSADLQQRQKILINQSIPHLADKVIWLTCLPTEFSGVIIANEVLDAMPVAKFRYQQHQHYECAVQGQVNAWVECTQPLSAAELEQQLDQLEIRFTEGYTSEVNCVLPGWLASLSQLLTQGLILLIDYGFPQHEYYHPQRSMGTLMCHYQHLAHDNYFWWPGLQDITAHVNFTAVAQSAYEQGLMLAGYTSQAHFLYSCGLEKMTSSVTSSVMKQYQISQQIKKLILPTEMGELFKVMALCKNFSQALLGFKLYDMRGKL